jgi:hypothetical protein
VGEACDPEAHDDWCEAGLACPDATSVCTDRAAALTTACDGTIPALTPGTSTLGWTSDTVGNYGLTEGSCYMYVGWEILELEPEALYTLEVTAASSVTITTCGSCISTDLPGTPSEAWLNIYVRTDCDDPATEVACSEPNGGPMVTADLDPGTYYVFVDSLEVMPFEILATVDPL